ncbi:MAG: nucleoside-diphosphate sugar epimerase [Lutibacter sp. BRH_c52]|nr:MAG: nucleoside-diphosphate sugar epimerase [Lutibacter sp. BRH_c52]HCE55703.1 nucleoside-diphosphate sugar epimerase [Lutibacter sp.]
MGKTAIILGASGLTGQQLLAKLIVDDRYKTIKLFSRKKTENTSSKVIEIVGDLLALENFKEDFTADELFVCIGTTAKKTPDKTQYKNIDFGIPAAAAKLAKENHIPTFIVVSAMGANAESSVFYNKTKGEMEQAVLSEKIKHTYFLRPSIISGNRNENRPMEKIGIAIFKLLQPLMVGKLKKYRLIEAENIAKAMIYLANKKPEIHIVESDKIQELALLPSTNK